MDLELRGKVAVVTGGSRGIGRAVARALAAEGASVAVVARGRPALETAARELAAETGATVLPVVCDTGSDESVRAMAAEVVERLGGVDVLVNCAAQPGGQAAPPRLSEIGDREFWDDVNVKVMGYVRCIRELAPHMAARGGGRIINISGLAARHTGSTIGSMRNVAVAALTKNLADELAPQGISVVVVHPGLTRTERTPEVLRARSEATGTAEAELEQAMARGILLGRLVESREVADVVAFLASPRAIAIDGDAVVAGGGSRGAIHY